jgi:hypothetical protein
MRCATLAPLGAGNSWGTFLGPTVASGHCGSGYVLGPLFQMTGRCLPCTMDSAEHSQPTSCHVLFSLEGMFAEGQGALKFGMNKLFSRGGRQTEYK